MDRARRRLPLDAPLSPAPPTATATTTATAASTTTSTGANGNAAGSSSVTFSQILVISAFSVGVVAAMFLGPRLVMFLCHVMRSPEERRRRAMLAAAAERTRLHAQETVPLSTGVLEKLPKLPFILDTPDSISPDFDRTCAVCLMEYEEGEELLSLPCSHRFHFDCVSLWFLSHCTCPTCRLCLNAAEKQDVEHGTGVTPTDGLERRTSEVTSAGMPVPCEGGRQEDGASTLIVEQPSTDIPVVHHGVPEEVVDLLVPGNMSVTCDALKHDELKENAGAVELRLAVEEEGNADTVAVMEEVQNLRPEETWNQMPRCLAGSGKCRQ